MTLGAARRLALTAALALGYPVIAAHIGSPDVIVSGKAGAYPVQVVVRPPDVIPGRAEVNVQVDAPGVTKVTVQAVLWSLGTKGAPKPDVATLIAGETRLYTSQLWLMTGGSYSVRVTVDGAQGEGVLYVPVNAVARKQLPLDSRVAMLLVALGVFLVVGMISIVWSATRESTLAPAQPLDGARRRRAAITASVTAVLLIGMLTGGKRWWDLEERAFRRTLDRQWTVATEVRRVKDMRVIHLEITDSVWRARQFTPLIPDHGKLMHMFVVGIPDMHAFAHLHPTRADTNNFEALLPAGFPAGRYRVYADIVHASGYSRTLVDSVTIPAANASELFEAVMASDPDASFMPSEGVSASAANGRAAFGDGTVMTWQRPATQITARRPLSLTFAITDAKGAPAELDPYMGIQGHAALMKADGKVFVHLHPMGTISMAAQQTFERRATGDTVLVREDTSSAHSMAMEKFGHVVSFPYEFPLPGSYRVWVQVKRGGRVHTGAFDVDVTG